MCGISPVSGADKSRSRQGRGQADGQSSDATADFS